MGANRMLVVAWGSASRSLAQVSVSFVVFCDGRRTPRLRVLSLLRLYSDMLERARGSEREREEGCGDLQVRGVSLSLSVCLFRCLCKCVDVHLRVRVYVCPCVYVIWETRTDGSRKSW